MSEATEPKPQQYELTPGERAILQQMNLATLNAKARVFELQQAIEQARADLALTQHALGGAVTLLAQAHGMINAQITPDFARIIAQ